QGRQHVPLPRLELAAPERFAARPVEVARQPVDPREHLERREVEVGSLCLPGVDDAVDLVVPSGHASIIAGAPSHHGRLDEWAGTDRVRGPPWCNGSTTAFGAVRFRFESWRRSMTDT